MNDKSARKKYFVDQPRLTEVGKNIRAIRKSKKMSISKLAVACEVDDSQIIRMEKGKVNYSFSMFFRIADGLGIDPKLLLPEQHGGAAKSTQ